MERITVAEEGWFDNGEVAEHGVKIAIAGNFEDAFLGAEGVFDVGVFEAGAEPGGGFEGAFEPGHTGFGGEEIEDDVDGDGVLLGVFADVELAVAGGGTPVDAAGGVGGEIGAEAVELVAGAGAAGLDFAFHLREEVLRVGLGFEGGVDEDVGMERDAGAAFGEAEGEAGGEFEGVVAEAAAAGEADAGVFGDGFAAGDHGEEDGLREAVGVDGLEAGGEAGHPTFFVADDEFGHRLFVGKEVFGRVEFDFETGEGEAVDEAGNEEGGHEGGGDEEDEIVGRQERRGARQNDGEREGETGLCDALIDPRAPGFRRTPPKLPHIVDNTTMDTAPELRRALHLRHLIFMGLIIIQPTAPMPLFGVVSNKAGGHVVSTVLVAMVGMLLTAISYGRMARVYPSAGSAYTYVGKEIHPTLGFLTGWGLLLDYVINPLICVIWCSKAAGNFLPAVPYAAWTIFFTLVFTWLNLRNIQAAANTHKYLAIVMGVVVAWMLGATAIFVQAHPTDFWKPFYDPATFTMSTFSAGTALAVLTYIGFDAISTLSEETVDAENTIPKATVIVCLLIGILSAIEVYAGQLVWPHGEAFPDVDTAYVYIAGRAGGMWLFHAVNLTLLVATVGSGSGGQMAGARLLFGMGRDNVLPPKFFARIDAVRQVPAWNVLLIGAISLAGALTLTYELGAELLNFGAFIGFIGVNLAAFLRAWRARSAAAIAPACGFLLCLYMWASLSPKSLLLGAAWATIGLVYKLTRK